MSRLLSYCFVALVVEVLWAASSFGGDPFATDQGPSGRAKPVAEKSEAAKPDVDVNDPFGGSVDKKPAAAPAGSAKPDAAKPDAANPFGEAARTPQAATKARSRPAPKKPDAAPRVAQPAGPFALQPEPASAEAKIKRALDHPTQIEFVETSLKDVVDYLRDLHHIEILLDSAALKQAGVDESTQVTQNFKGISLRLALQLLLAQIPGGEVTYAIHDDVLLITTKEKAESFLVTKLYDVADLVVCQDSNAKFWDDYETLIDVIRETVPQSWDVNGGKGTVKGASMGAAKVLVVSQTQQVHEEIAAVLKEIRDVAAKNRDTGAATWPQRDPPKQPSVGRLRVGVRSNEAPTTVPSAEHRRSDSVGRPGPRS